MCDFTCASVDTGDSKYEATIIGEAREASRGFSCLFFVGLSCEAVVAKCPP